MKIGKKFLYYGFGVFLGILAVNFFWDQKDIKMTYFPSSRILHDFGKKELKYKPEAVNQLNTYSISKVTIQEKIKEGSFDAELLDRDAKPCKTYRLISDFNSIAYNFEFQNCDSVVTLLNVTK